MKKKVIFESQEQTVSILELADSCHIGFIQNIGTSTKGYIISVNKLFHAVYCEGTAYYCNAVCKSDARSIYEAVKIITQPGTGINQVFVFDTRKELYQWLAQD